MTYHGFVQSTSFFKQLKQKHEGNLENMYV